MAAQGELVPLYREKTNFIPCEIHWMIKVRFYVLFVVCMLWTNRIARRLAKLYDHIDHLILSVSLFGNIIIGQLKILYLL